MPYNSETGLYERRSTTVIDATPDGDTVAVAIDDKLDAGIDDAVTDLNHHDANGNHYPDVTVTTTKQYLAKSPAGAVSWRDGVPLDEAVESTMLAATDGSDMVGYGAGTVTDALDSHASDIATNATAISTNSAALAASGGSALVGFLQDGTGAVARTAQAKMRDFVSVKDFGAVGDGVTDDTAAVHAAIDYAKGVLGTVYFPAGTYRVTYGYTQSVDYKNIRLLGDGVSNEGTQGGSIIKLDNEDTGSFFYKQAARHKLLVEKLVFTCEQEVTDRVFFWFSSANGVHFMQDVNFESVEKPLYFGASASFQSSGLRNVQFRNSGTIHSEITGVATLYTIDNVNHELSVPENSEKIVCNLTGIRHLNAKNFLLEGALPSSGWTVLKVDGSASDAPWTRAKIGEITNFWCEWDGTAPECAIHQVSGRLVINGANGYCSSTSPHKIEGQGHAVVKGVNFCGSAENVNDKFDLEDYLCTVQIIESSVRRANFTSQQFTFEGCSYTYDGAVGNYRLVPTVFWNTAPSQIYKWGGGLIDAIVTTSISGTQAFSTDATYGRKIIITPASTSSLAAAYDVPARGIINVNDQFFGVCTIKLPEFTDGTIIVYARENFSTKNKMQVFTTSDSGGTFDVMFPIKPTTDPITSVGLRIAAVSSTSLSGDLEIYTLAFYLGATSPKKEYPAYPTKTTSYATAAPSSGTWAEGDIVFNSTPSAGGSVGWVCVTAGTPGTWKTFGAISA